MVSVILKISLIGFTFLTVSCAVKEKIAQSPNANTAETKTVDYSELERSRSLWRESGITNYRVTVDIQKTGHAAPSGKFIITVRKGVAKSIKPVDKPEVEVLGSNVKFESYETLEDIFLFIERADKKALKWNKRQVEYDSKLGYPKYVNMDEAGVLDDEMSYQVLQFEALE
jgi:hypothetical protein